MFDYVKGDSVFIKENTNRTQYPYLDKNIKTDVLVIGGGVTGALVGHYFSKADINCVIIDKARIGHCSTSITTSLLQYELDSSAQDLKKELTEEEIIRAYNLGLFALDEIKDMIEEIGNECYYKKVDCLLYTSKESDVKTVEDEYNFRKDNGFDVKFIKDKNQYFGFDFEAGLLSKNGGAVLDPFLFTHSLIKNSCKNGMKVYENTEAVKLNYEKDTVIVETSYDYTIECKKVICATGYNTKLFTNTEFATKYTTFNIATNSIENINPILKNIVCRDTEDPYHYFRTTHDNRIILGGEDIKFKLGIDNEKKCAKSYDKLEELLSNLFNDINATVEYKYCGAFATTKDNLGIIGPDTDHNNLWYCLGYGANGILFAVLGGYYLSKLYLGNSDPNMDLFRVER